MLGMRSTKDAFTSTAFFTGERDNVYVAASISVPGKVIMDVPVTRGGYMTPQEAVNLATALLNAADEARRNEAALED